MDKSAQNILNKNSWWWRNTPNETYYREDIGMNFPTNLLTAYTLDDIGGSKDIVLLNQYVISTEGQPSTLQGEDTTIDKKDDMKYVFQREYLVLVMPKIMGKNFFKNFNPKRKCIKIIEEYDYVDNKIKSSLKYNDFARDFIETRHKIPKIWVTATKSYSDGEIEYITNAPLNAEYYKDLTYKDGRNLIFNVDNKSPIENFVVIELIRPEIGLNDDPTFVEKFKEEGTGGILNKYITPKTKNDVSLIEEVITYFQDEIYDCLNKPVNTIKSDAGSKQKSKRRKSKQKSKKRKSKQKSK